MVGTFTYDATNNAVIAVGGTAQTPVGFVDLWNADKAGTLSLHARSGIAGVDDANMALTRNARPTDRVVLGGAKQDLFIVVSAWTNMTSATVQLIGTDSAGNAQTEDLALTGNVTIYAAKYFVTLTHSKVTAWVGTGSFAYEVTQSQLGVVWKQSSTQFVFDCKIVVGDGSTATYFTDTNKQVKFNIAGLGTPAILVKNSATFTCGVLIDSTLKTTKYGVSFIIHMDYYGNGFIQGETTSSSIYLYGCFAIGEGDGTYFEPEAIVCGGKTVKIYDGTFSYVRNLGRSLPSTADLNRNTVSYAEKIGEGSLGTTLDTKIATSVDIWVFSYGTSVTVKNLISYNSTNGFAPYQTTVDHYLINVVPDVWKFLWNTSPNSKVFRQYEFDLAVTDAAGNPVQDATVSLKDKNGAQIFSATTDVNGRIATQTVTRGYYQQSTGDTLQDSSPHTLKIEKAGYQNYAKKFTLQEKTKWEIKLAKAQAILLDGGKPVVNLRASDPENKHVLQL